MAEGGRLADHATRFAPPAQLHVPVLAKIKVPIVTIPCTASGAEVTPSLGIRDPEGRKLLFTDPQLASRVVLLDPKANTDVPAHLMLSTGMNGVAHCLEGLYSKERSPLAELLAIDAIQRFARALPAVRTMPADVAARGELLYAAHLSGLVLVNARTCLHHAVCHAIGSVTGAPHGEANAVLLPHALRFNLAAVRPQLERAAAAVGCDDAIAWVDTLREQLGVPCRLRDIGVRRETLERIASKTMGERGLYFNPRPVQDAAEILGLLEQAF
jgi:alcohol dehydrogenase